MVMVMVMVIIVVVVMVMVKVMASKTKREYKDHINHWNKVKCDSIDLLLKIQEGN